MNDTSTLDQWLERIERLHPREIELGLDRVQKVAAALLPGVSQHKTVVIAGTNGKGSTVAALAAILRQHGLSVAAYTSPHLLRFNERIELDGEPVSDEQLCQAFSAVESARADIALTYFEYTTLAALYCFASFRPHVCLLEVGLGGRLDAVNIVDGDITLITNIALDHQDWLGDDREAIGMEKAGILREGVPAICAERAPPASVSTAARAIGAPWYRLDDAFALQLDNAGWQWHGRDMQGQALALSGACQPQLHADAVAAAIQAACLLLAEPVAALVDRALASASLCGRRQFIPLRDGELVLDVAHNPAAAACLQQALQSAKFPGKTHLIFAMLADKAAAECAQALATEISGEWWLPQIQATRSLNPDDLATALPPEASYKICVNVDAALDLALPHLAEGDRVVVTGSFYTVAQVLQTMQRRGINIE